MTRKSSISLACCLSYAAPEIPMLWLIAPIGIIQGIYAKYYGLSLTTIAIIVLVAKLVDAISDPLIGYYSDCYRSRTGTRNPFMLLGGLLFLVCACCLYMPPVEVGVVYFAAWFIMLYLGYTLFEIPHVAWGSELSLSSTDKAKIYNARNIAGYAGQILFFTIPLLPFFETRDITPTTLQVSVIVAGILLFPLLVYCLKATPNSASIVATHKKDSTVTDTSALNSKTVSAQIIPPKDRWKESRLLLQSITGNKPFLLFITAYLLMGIGSGMWYGLIFIYVDAYLGMGDQFAQMFLLAFVVGMLSSPIWYWLATLVGNKSAWAIAMVLLAVSFIYTGTLVPEETSFRALLLLKVVQTMGFSCSGVIAPALLSEIVDYSTWKTGKDRAGTFFGGYITAAKFGGAFSSALGLGIAGWYGFNPAATIHSETSVSGLILAISQIPPIFALIALLFIALNPINTRRYAIIRRRLDTQAIRAVIKINELEEQRESPAQEQPLRSNSAMSLPESSKA